jgi:hypothetical protein
MPATDKRSEQGKAFWLQTLRANVQDRQSDINIGEFSFPVVNGQTLYQFYFITVKSRRIMDSINYLDRINPKMIICIQSSSRPA